MEELIRVSGLRFSYPSSPEPALDGVDLTLREGEFRLLCGPSGCGKSTLLRCLKPQLTPHGALEGARCFFGGSPEDRKRETAGGIGFVFQDPDSQVVTDTVAHELSFGLENLGVSPEEIRQRVAETALFFGIDDWIGRSVHEVSGGEKQLLNLASVIAMRPRVLLLDEPTSRLDPVASRRFLDLLTRVNREMGIAVLVCEHRLEELLPLSDRVLLMEDGKIAAAAPPRAFVRSVLETPGHPFAPAMPAAARIAAFGPLHDPVPLTVREGRAALSGRRGEPIPLEEPAARACLLESRGVWFRYRKELPFVLRGADLSLGAGSIHALLGGNGAGKTTLLQLLAGLLPPLRGKVKPGGERPKTALLWQEPKAMFSRDTVEEELLAREGASALAEEFGLLGRLRRHPYDLSGGEQQRLALALVLAGTPDLLLLDEPTKGLDPFLKEELARLLKRYQKKGGTVLLTTHDVEFAARHADTCSLLFGGEIVSTAPTRRFFAANALYTTSAARILSGFVQNSLTAGDAAALFLPEVPAENPFLRKEQEEAE